MTICYFGIYNPDFGRNKVYMAGLKALGVNIIECRDTSPGIIKYWKLFKKHRAIVKGGGMNGGYDALIVGYPGHIVVPLAKLISRKTVIFDALCTLYEGEVISRGKYKNNPFMRVWIKRIDRRAVKKADVVLVETDAQKSFFIERFGLEGPQADKVVRIFTGADESIFHPDVSIMKRSKFTAVFRGKFLPEAGVEYIIKAAALLQDKGINFLIIGNGHLEKEIKRQIDSSSLTNVEWVSGNLDAGDLRTKMLECHVSLGQFGNNERLKRTIPHKAFETLAMGLPYITGRAEGIEELLTDGKDCLMVNCADPKDLADKILMLKDDSEVLKMIAENGTRLFQERLTATKLAEGIVSLLN